VKHFVSLSKKKVLPLVSLSYSPWSDSPQVYDEDIPLK